MSVLIETSLGDIVVDLYTKRAPKACINFLKLCKIKYYNYSLFHTIQLNFTAQVGGDASGNKDSGVCVWSLLPDAPDRKYFPPEIHPKLKHTKKGVVSFATSATTPAGGGGYLDASGKAVTDGIPLAGSQFFITLTDSPLEYLDGRHAVFGQVVEGLEILDSLNSQHVDDEGRPFRDIRIKHTIILDDPFPDPEGLPIRSRSPSPPEAMLKSKRLAEDEELFPDIDPELLEKQAREREAAARALTLEMIGDLPFAEIKPPENVLFVCKLNPVTRDEDLELIFSRFGEILSCEIIRDKKSGDSLCYAFIEFAEKSQAEEAYFKMDNVLIDDRRIHVDFSQSVSKLHQDFMVGKRRKLNEEEEFGGKGLQRRRQYRDGGDFGRKRGADDDGRDYQLVFDHGGDLDREKRKKGRVDEDGSDDGDKKPRDEKRPGSRSRSGGGGGRRDFERERDSHNRDRDSRRTDNGRYDDRRGGKDDKYRERERGGRDDRGRDDRGGRDGDRWRDDRDRDSRDYRDRRR
ncbi:Peptidyl-prolyl cis-trans isomerase cyp6 [Blyttiomyces sp. JEL0837]|nr:Peptidyl-prolyl cis-trans isomerase cyp6 [Blyttiomyces sp. JEL0837]